MSAEIEAAVAALGPGPLTETAVAQHLRPLFSRTLASPGIYLASHTLGRPLDQSLRDIAEYSEVWATQRRDAWGPWLAEEAGYRAAIANLLGTAPAVVAPKPSASAAFRAVAHTLPLGATVLTTDAEFASSAMIFANLQALGRLRVLRVRRDELLPTLRSSPRTTLVVVSHVFYGDGQLYGDLSALSEACLEAGATLLVDAYHSFGAVPIDLPAMDCDYLIGGCFKYLRGGPGAAFLALGPRVQQTRPADSGWFALKPDADPWNGDGPELASAGDGWLDGTPDVLPYYATRAGLAFTTAIGVDRLREYSLKQLVHLRQLLAERGIEAHGGDAKHGAFLVVPCSQATRVVEGVVAKQVILDERKGNIRVCPDVLTTTEELAQTAETLAACWL